MQNIKKEANTINILKGIYKYLSKKRKLQLLFSISLMITSGLSEVITISAIFPFLTVLSSPEIIWNYPTFSIFLNQFGITDSDQLLKIFSALFCFAALLSGCSRLANLWIINRLSVLIGSDLSCKCYERILTQPYSFHTQVNSSEVIATVSTKIKITVGSIYAFLQFVTGLIISFFLIVCLIKIDFQSSLIASLVISSIYFVISLKTKKMLIRNSEGIAEGRDKQVKSIQEGLGGIKEILMGSYQSFYIKIYRNIDLPMRINEANNTFLASFPRFAVESIAIILIISISLFIKYRSNSSDNIIPLVATFALAAQRLLPAMQLSYNNIASVRGNSSEVLDVIKILNKPKNKILNPSQIDPISLKKNIIIKDLSFQYKGEKRNVLNKVNIEINKGERVAIIGKSGFGKSTLLEIIMGLLEPTNGEILIDGLNINNKNNSLLNYQWRKSISYIPQEIYLTDSSFAENIAFGVPLEEIDLKMVKSAAKKAKISDFISSTKRKYKTFIGERGVRLSGGQRQRIGIARALYKNNSILAFDEATSSLDHKTENDVMESIEGLSKELTIIFVTHRLNTISFCNKVINLEDE